MGVAFNNATPMDIRKRMTLADSSLLGTSGDWTSLGTGPGNTNTFSGFPAARNILCNCRCNGWTPARFKSQ
jgi:hypothetical protein